MMTSNTPLVNFAPYREYWLIDTNNLFRAYTNTLVAILKILKDICKSSVCYNFDSLRILHS